MGKYDDWPRSPIRKAMAPSVPVYISIPMWPGQLPVLTKIGGHLQIPASDLVTYAALSFVTSFATREELFTAFKEADRTFGRRGMRATLCFPLEWPDTPWATRTAKFTAELETSHAKITSRQQRKKSSPSEES